MRSPQRQGKMILALCRMDVSDKRLVDKGQEKPKGSQLANAQEGQLAKSKPR